MSLPGMDSSSPLQSLSSSKSLIDLAGRFGSSPSLDASGSPTPQKSRKSLSVSAKYESETYDQIDLDFSETLSEFDMHPQDAFRGDCSVVLRSPDLVGFRDGKVSPTMFMEVLKNGIADPHAAKKMLAVLHAEVKSFELAALHPTSGQPVHILGSESDPYYSPERLAEVMSSINRAFESVVELSDPALVGMKHGSFNEVYAHGSTLSNLATIFTSQTCDPIGALEFVVAFAELNLVRNVRAQKGEGEPAPHWRLPNLLQKYLPEFGATRSLIFVLSAFAHIEGDLKDAAKDVIKRRVDDFQREGKTYCVLSFVQDFLHVETIFAEVTDRVLKKECERGAKFDLSAREFITKPLTKFFMKNGGVFDVLKIRNTQLAYAIEELRAEGVIGEENFVCKGTAIHPNDIVFSAQEVIDSLKNSSYSSLDKAKEVQRRMDVYFGVPHSQILDSESKDG